MTAKTLEQMIQTLKQDDKSHFIQKDEITKIIDCAKKKQNFKKKQNLVEISLPAKSGNADAAFSAPPTVFSCDSKD